MQLRGPVITATHVPQLQLRALDAIVYIWSTSPNVSRLQSKNANKTKNAQRDANTAAVCSKVEPKFFTLPQTPSWGRAMAKI